MKSRSIENGDKLNIVEFAGASGVGKTTLIKALLEKEAKYRKLEKVSNNLVKNLVFETLSRKYRFFSPKILSLILKISPNFILKDLLKRTGLSSRMVMYYGKKYPGCLQLFEKYVKSYTNDKNRISKVLNWIIRIIERYMILEQHYSINKPILVDEGFVQRGASIFCPPQPSKAVLEKDIRNYSESIPIPNQLVLLEANPSICESRMRNRKTGYPSSYNSLSKEEMKDRIQCFDKCFEIISEVLELRGTEVIKINAKCNLGKLVKIVDEKIRN